MENIKISETCGLCAGCKRAVDKTLEHVQNGESVTLFKEIVHNKNVNNFLSGKGVIFVDEIEKLTNSGIVILRAHGEPKSTFDFLNAHNISYDDCTCPNVKNIHKQVESFNANGFKIIIIGKYGKHSGKPHPEIVGTIGWCKNEPILIEDIEDVKKLEDVSEKDFYLVCQTTFNAILVEDIISKVSKVLKNKNLIINKSICYAQRKINSDSAKLAHESDLMIVVGGKNSSNSLELYKNLKSITNCIFIENINDWKSACDENNIKITTNTKIGLTAGASTFRNELEDLKNLINKYLEKSHEHIN